jgi:type I restriction enzyme R subunit
MTQQPEITFQKHIAAFLVREHKYGLLEQSDITDPEYAIAEDHLWAFLQDTQPDSIKKLLEEYGTDARDEVFRGLKRELAHTPLWMIMRHGLRVRGLDFRLFFPQPRSSESEANKLYGKNRVTVRPHYYFGDTNKEIDIVLFLNGLPVIAIELKHEKNQNVHDAVAQFTQRDHTHRIFQLPFLYIAADTSDVMVATDPRREENFRWFNTGLTNAPITEGEYPIEFVYREVLSQERILEAVSFFLIGVPHQDAKADKPERAAFTLFPRYHQSRMVRKVAADATDHFTSTGNVGRKYLINHSAGSGKTLSICWLADRIHSLFKPNTSEKLVDIVFVLTDRKSLDKNIRDEIENFTHLTDVVAIARRAGQLEQFVSERRAIIVTTQQKFAWILETLEKDTELRKLRVAFLIDEAHRSQEGNLGAAIRRPFRETGGSEAEQADAEVEIEEDDEVSRIIREHDHNQLFAAFTATPSPATVTLFGEPFDTYSEGKQEQAVRWSRNRDNRWASR